jgi:hypothetical protein
MELATFINENVVEARVSSDSRFIQANTKPVTLNHLRDDCVIPVFSKDNEPTISNADFVESVYNAVQNVFCTEDILRPSVRVSHPIKGRIPEAKDKAAEELLEGEKTVYYERVMFTVEIPSIYRVINGNHLTLTVGGVRGYQLENLYSKRGLQKFKVFIGFRNRVCCNMCVSTDGILDDLKVGSVSELTQTTENLLLKYESAETLAQYSHWGRTKLTEQQFAEFLGRCRMLNYMPLEEKKQLPELLFTDHHLNLVTEGYFKDKNFGRERDGSIDLWKIYNLFTSANKSSYIDRFLERGVNASTVVSNLESYLF